MIEIHIPPNKTVQLKHLCLDLNGTIAFNKQIIDGVAERLHKLKDRLKIHVITADTFGNAVVLLKELPVNVALIPENEQARVKAHIVDNLGCKNSVSIGNGFNDRLMLANSALSIAVIGGEGCALQAIQSAMISVYSINDALDLLLYPERVKATLRD